MKITIDNLRGQGAVDCTWALDETIPPRVERTLNEPSRFRCSLVGGADFAVPGAGANIKVANSDGDFLFTGYLEQTPQYEYLGEGERGPVYRYDLVATSDEFLLDQKALPDRAPLVARSAGSAMKQLLEDLGPDAFDTSGVQDLDVLASYYVNPQKKFSDHAAAIAAAARGSYRVVDGAFTLQPIGSAAYEIREDDPTFSPAGLKLLSMGRQINDITAIGLEEPQGYVRDYFVGDGLSRSFYLSQRPFYQSRKALIDEQYRGVALDPATWIVSDPASAVSVRTQALQVAGGTGRDGETTLTFVERIELGGALELQHGEVTFSGASKGILGGLYAGKLSSASCVAGFQVSPAGATSVIQALVGGTTTGPVITTTAGHRYLLTTYLYSREVYRSGETYHSSSHPAGTGIGGDSVAANVRVVLEVQDINPSDPATLVLPAVVLYDDVIPDAPGFCTYSLVNAANMQYSVTSTYVTHIALAEVRTALPDSPYKTVLVESLVDGGQCYIANSASLDFYPQYVPPLNTLIVASYRGYGRAVARVRNEESIAALAEGTDNGARGIVRAIQSPSARTQSDCENAALALLDDMGSAGWAGTYQTWSDFLPGSAPDIFPGDVLRVNVESRDADFEAIVRGVEIDYRDPANDRGVYTIQFANEAAAGISVETEASAAAVPLQDVPIQLATTQVGAYYLENLVNAQVTQVTSTTVQIDAGLAIGGAIGIEVRTRDIGWGAASDRSLLGRFSSRTFTLPRLGRTQTYFLRLYDGSSPIRYSRYAAVLHVDYPL